ncbi:MAG: DUF87 domain-containing protein [Clostridiales bacterium]|nr:DUF87 domain-containing protein [Clostridiales bacterium]
MRLIPKKTKLDSTIWKSLTLIDIILIFALFMLGVVIGLSNIPGKWVILFIYVPLCVLLFIPFGEVKAYKDIFHVVKYLFSHKHFTRNASAAKNVAALVPGYKLDEDGVLDYDSYQAAVISVGSIEFALLSVYQQNERISAFATAFNMLAENETAQIVKIDRPINFDDISKRTYEKLMALEKSGDAAKKLIMRRRLGQLDNLNNVEKLYRPYYYIVLYSSTRSSLNVLVGNVLQALSRAGLDSNVLTAKEVCTFLKYCNTRDFDEREIEDVPPEQYLDYITPRDVKFTTKNYIADGTYAFTYAISDYPLSVTNAWGADLFNINNTKVVLTIKPIERYKAIRRIDKTIIEIGTRSEGNRASEMIEQNTHLETMGALLTSLQNENELLFDCTLTITGFNNTEMSNAAFRRAVRQRIVSSNFKTSMLRYRQLDGYIASSISARTALKSYSRGINSESIAAVFPFVFTAIIDPEGMTLGESGGYPFIFDPFKWEHSSGEFLNANMFVAGTPGSGKSYFAKSFLEQLHSENAAIYALDPENEYKHLCNNVGGRFIDVGNATTGRINPFHIYQILSDEEDENGEPIPVSPQAVFSAHLQYLENFFAVTLPGINSDTLEEINNLIVQCYAKKKITQETDCSKYAPDKFPTFDDLYKLVQSELNNEKGGIRYGNLQRAETYLAKFAKGGRFANLWNGASTLNAADRFTVFNFQSLFEAKNKVTSNGQMLTVLRFLEQQIINLRERNANKPRSERLRPIVVLDEGYMFIDPSNTWALDFVYQWYKRIRKYSGAMIFLTQNLADIVGNAEIISKTSAIINNTQYSFIMTLQGKDVEALQDIFSARNLTQAEIEEIQRTNKPKGTAFFMGSSAQRAMLHVVTDEVVETLFSRPVDVEKMLEPPKPSAENEGETTAPSAEENTQKESFSSGVDIPQGV